jgi:hypothetical protein
VNRAREKSTKASAQIDTNFISDILGKETADESVGSGPATLCSSTHSVENCPQNIPSRRRKFL